MKEHERSGLWVLDFERLREIAVGDGFERVEWHFARARRLRAPISLS